MTSIWKWVKFIWRVDDEFAHLPAHANPNSLFYLGWV